MYGKVRETQETFDKLRVIRKCHLYIVAYVHNILTFILSEPTPGVWTPTVGLIILLAVQVYGKVGETHETFDKLRVIGKCHSYIVAYVHNILTFILSESTPPVWTPTVGLIILLAVHVHGKLRETHETFDKLGVTGKYHLYYSSIHTQYFNIHSLRAYTRCLDSDCRPHDIIGSTGVW